MDFAFDEEQSLLVATFRRWSERALRGWAAEADRQARHRTRCGARRPATRSRSGTGREIYDIFEGTGRIQQRIIARQPTGTNAV